MPDVETIMEPWMDGGDDRRDIKMPDFENSDLLTLIDEVCGTCFNFYSYLFIFHSKRTLQPDNFL